MEFFAWIESIRELSPAALTVRAQAISPNDQDRLLWDAFAPRQDVDSVNLNHVRTIDDRPTADRREWNANGRYIPKQIPDREIMSIVPIEAFDKIEEKEMQDLMERTLGNAALIQEIIGTSIPQRVDRLVSALYRRLEVDTFSAWALGKITQRNPQTGVEYDASFDFDPARYQTPATPWDDPSLNFYDEFLAWVEDGIGAVGGTNGVALRLSTLKKIQAAAPQGVMQTPLTRTQVEDLISQNLGTAFRFYVIEHHVDEFQTGGVTKTLRKVWPEKTIALVPPGERIGYTAFAPVVRAMQLSAQVPEAGIDHRGATVYHDAAAGGKELTLTAQLNAAPVPDEQRMWVVYPES